MEQVNTEFTGCLRKGDKMRSLIKKKNKILVASIVFAVGVACLSAIAGYSVLMIISIAYLFFMLFNNLDLVVGEKDDVDELLEAEREYDFFFGRGNR